MARSDESLRALGLGPDADASEVRAARRRLARQVHPDAGGDNAAMASINAAATRALHDLEGRSADSGDTAPTDPGDPPSEPSATSATEWSVQQHDVPSFTVEALPVETFEALLVAAASFGEVIDDDPPYRLEVLMVEPFECWCRFDVVPDAGASTVSLAVAQMSDRDRPRRTCTVEQVRDVWVDALNGLDWSALSGAVPPP